MIKVTDIVKEILFSSAPEFTAFSRGLLNLSAYAKRIKPEVERRAMKPVQTGTIVVALSRLSATLATENPLLPNIELNAISVKSNLVEIAFNKTSDNKLRTQKLYNSKEILSADFLTVTYGASEISIFAEMALAQSIKKTFRPDLPKYLQDNLAALTVQFSEKYVDIPNFYFAIFQAIAVRKINIVDVVSTFTEFTFLVNQKDLNDLFVLMNSLMRQKQKSAESQLNK